MTCNCALSGHNEGNNNNNYSSVHLFANYKGLIAVTADVSPSGGGAVTVTQDMCSEMGRAEDNGSGGGIMGAIVFEHRI